MISGYVNVCQGDGSGCIQVQTSDEGATSYFMIRTDLWIRAPRMAQRMVSGYFER